MHKQDFPILNNSNLVYLDSAATSQKPLKVIEAESSFYKTSNANVHRGIYPLSEKSTAAYENARADVAKFINAQNTEIIFTSGTTDSLNKLAQMLHTSGKLKTKIVLSELEHHSNLLPWRALPGVKVEYLPVKNFEVDISNLALDADVVALSLASNVTGAILNIREIVETLRRLSPKTLIVLDAAQAVSHMPIDVRELDVDFLAFSGHKMYGPMGIGFLWGKSELLAELEPAWRGGGMIREVSKENVSWDDVPSRFEAGTPPVAQAIGLAAACNYLLQIGWEKIEELEKKVSGYALEQLKTVNGLELYHPSNASVPVFSFSVDGLHPHDLAEQLGNASFGSTNSEICVRAGHHCTQILHREVFQIPASCRVSLGIYNTAEDIDILITKLNEVIKFFKSA